MKKLNQKIEELVMEREKQEMLSVDLKEEVGNLREQLMKSEQHR